jgi:hypothetical protein
MYEWVQDRECDENFEVWEFVFDLPKSLRKVF